MSEETPTGGLFGGHRLHSPGGIFRASLAELAQDRQGLLAYAAQPLQRRLALADRVLEGVQWLKARPLLLAAIAVFPVLLRPRRAITGALKLSGTWRMWRRIQRLVIAA